MLGSVGHYVITGESRLISLAAKRAVVCRKVEDRSVKVDYRGYIQVSPVAMI